MKAIFKGQIIEFDENDQKAIAKLADAIGCSTRAIINAIQSVINATDSLSNAIESIKIKLEKLSDACDDALEKIQYEHSGIKEKPEYCTQ